MIEVPITEDMIIKAKRMADGMGVLKASIMQGKGNLYGFLGELIYLEACGGKHLNTYDYDIVMDDGTKVDVKTKKTSAVPKPHYDASISNHNLKQACDIYGFCRVKDDLSVGWVLGNKSKVSFFDGARFVKRGEYDPSNGFKARSDHWSMPIKELDQVS